MKLALSQEEENQRTVHGGNVRNEMVRRAEEGQAAGVPVNWLERCASQVQEKAIETMTDQLQESLRSGLEAG